MSKLWRDDPFGYGVVIDTNHREYLWKESRDSDITHVKIRNGNNPRNGDDVYVGRVRSRILVVGINPETDKPARFKVRDIDCADIDNVIEFFKVCDLYDTYPDEQEESGFVFWSGHTDPYYKKCTKKEALKLRKTAKVVEMYCE